MIKYSANLPMIGAVGVYVTPKVTVWYSIPDDDVICEIEAIPKGKLCGSKRKVRISLDEARQHAEMWNSVVLDYEQECAG